jgi:uncharacterized LabA/DUF88 family protein
MRIHQNQVNPNAQLDAMHAAQKAAAKREAEKTRKKLFESASEVAADGDSEAFVVQLEERQDSDSPSKRNLPSPQARKRSNAKADSDNQSSLSDWA